MAGDRLPEPQPLAKAVAEANFGYDEDNHPIHPTAEQIQEMTETQAAKLMAIYEQMRSRPEDTDPSLQAAADSLLRSYAGNFGERAALQLDKYARRRTSIQSPGSPSGRSR